VIVEVQVCFAEGSIVAWWLVAEDGFPAEDEMPLQDDLRVADDLLPAGD
jgi:hypothetical protein